MEFVEQNFYFQSMRKTETNYYQLWTLRLTITKVKSSFPSNVIFLAIGP